MLLILALWIVPVIVGSDLLLEGVYHDREAETLDEIQLDEPSPFSLPDELLDPQSTAALQQLGGDIEVPDIVLPVAAVDAQAAHRSTTTAAEASSVEGAVDGITDSIRALLEKGDLLVIWLLDSSQSLVDDRKRVAARLEPFFDEVRRNRADQDHRLLNAVVSFGAGLQQRVAPSEFADRIVNSVEKLPVDKSGKENVFAAIAESTRNYRKKWAGQLLVVVWTDETGDDTERAEETIAICRKHRATVAVVGPSAVLGAETGLHSYTEPETDVTYQLPVRRGPDSAVRERIELGYWFWVRPPGSAGWRPENQPRGGFRRGPAFPSWYGGRDLVGIVSGFSPHALTRVAVHTGGSYTIFDRPEDRGPFRAEAMPAYAPDGRSVAEYRADAEQHPLRRGVLQAVEETVGQQLTAPESMFFVVRDKYQPASFYRPYLTPAQFVSRLRATRRSWLRKAARQARVVEKALAHVSEGTETADSPLREYDLETSPRWRAWYQLTRGRLLVVSVRLEEYRLALEAVGERGFLESTTNHLVLRPSQRLVSGPLYQTRAAEAAELLQTCIAEHADTPWAYLAQRELAHYLGIQVRQRSLEPTGLAPEQWQPRLPKL